jgi:hypothetical protein
MTLLPLQAQWSLPAESPEQDGATPAVFLIGQNESTYEQLMLDHSTMLLAVCENDMNKAYGKWVDLLASIEDHSKEVDFDLGGIKLWLNVFWNENGSIEHIVYHPKPNCRNVRTEDLSEFFASFVDSYVGSIQGDAKFAHYGSATFPTFMGR